MVTKTNHKNGHELAVKQLRRVCDPKSFKFTSTKTVPALEKVIGQERALGALAFGVDIQSHGYHIYALGPVGTGKTTTIHRFLEKVAKGKLTPNDWLYVNNFEDRDRPHILQLPAGKGREFRDDIDQMVVELSTEVPKAFEGKQYTQEQERIEQEFQRRSKEIFAGLDKKSDKMGFKLLQTPQGMAALPVVADKVLTPESDIELDANQKKAIEHNQDKLQTEMRETMHRIGQLQKEGKKLLRDLDQRLVSFAVDHLINDLKVKYAKFKEIVEYLKESRAFLLKNVQTFKQIKQLERSPQQAGLSNLMSGKEPSFDEYRVNLVVDNSKTKGIPVILEKNPTGPNLIGRIEQQGFLGTLVTNFRMVKSGSLHKANGGYLIIDALDLLKKPFAWQVLKRALKNEEIVVESMHEAYGALVTNTLEPEPIPLKTKVILIGDSNLYYMLYNMDQEFNELFKVKADFEIQMDWGSAALREYSQFISTICKKERLKHFAPSAVAKIVEHGARMVSHQKKLSTQFGDIIDLVREANYWGGKNGNKLVQKEHVAQALEDKVFRSNRIEERMRELITDGTILIDVDDSVVGQVNGLAVLSLGDYRFGKPSRITVRTYVGHRGVISIDREVDLGGPIHNKGTMILIGYFGGKYAKDIAPAFSASITFEQLYDGVEGDSATCAEIYALLSSLSGYPLRQDLAVTGSANQLGEVQAIGGANEKIEGFFQICKIKGLTGTQGVIIPKSNIDNLMLHDDVVAAVKKGKFHIYAVSTVDEGITLLTGKTSKSVDKAVHARIAELAEKVQKSAKTKKKATKKATKTTRAKKSK